MTVKEWLQCQELQAIAIVREKANEMIEEFRRDGLTSIEYVKNLPEK